MKPVRIVAIRKTPEAEKESMRKIKRKHSRNQLKAPSSQTLEMNKYIILATSLDRTTYSNEKISELYRARWQIEQVFYRLKSLFNLGEIPCKREESVKAWFYGKLFLAILAETIIKVESFSPEEETGMSFDFVKSLE